MKIRTNDETLHTHYTITTKVYNFMGKYRPFTR